MHIIDLNSVGDTSFTFFGELVKTIFSESLPKSAFWLIKVF